MRMRIRGRGNTKRLKRPDAALRRRRALFAIGAVVALTTISVLDHAGALLAPRGDHARLDARRFPVARVIDGDTIDIGVPDPVRDQPATRVRLWGIDAPEMGWGERDDEPYALEATRKVESLLESAHVTIRMEPHRARGRFGRILAHVELDDGTDLAERLLRAGLARAERRWPHSRLALFIELERDARARGVGVWSDVPHAP